MFRAVLVYLVALVLPLAGAAPTVPADIASKILAPLLDPAKVDTLKGARPINARLYRVFYWLETARRAGGRPVEVLDLAQAAAHYAGSCSRAGRTFLQSGSDSFENKFGKVGDDHGA